MRASFLAAQGWQSMPAAVTAAAALSAAASHGGPVAATGGYVGAFHVYSWDNSSECSTTDPATLFIV